MARQRTRLTKAMQDRVRKFDSLRCRVLVCRHIKLSKRSLHTKYPGAPPCGENREAGETPARSRHCYENDAQVSIL